MYKAIYNLDTGVIQGYIGDEIDHVEFMSNWDNVDYIEVDQYPGVNDLRTHKWSVDLSTKKLVIIPNGI